MPNSITLQQLNEASEPVFIELLADIFEHSSWIPERAVVSRPFENLSKLHESMVNIVKQATEVEQLGLLRAHPQLAGKEAQQGDLTALSSGEQSSVGMNALSSEQMQEVKRLNQQYVDKFGFPFIIAVLDNTRDQIFEKWRKRLNHDYEDEKATCLEQVYLIAQLRLNALIDV